jgi:hypothetical protein
VVKNKNEENHISDTHCFLRVCKSGCCIGVVGARFRVLKLFIARLFAVVCVCFFCGWCFQWWICSGQWDWDAGSIEGDTEASILYSTGRWSHVEECCARCWVIALAFFGRSCIQCRDM